MYSQRNYRFDNYFTLHCPLLLFSSSSLICCWLFIKWLETSPWSEANYIYRHFKTHRTTKPLAGKEWNIQQMTIPAADTIFCAGYCLIFSFLMPFKNLPLYPQRSGHRLDCIAYKQTIDKYDTHHTSDEFKYTKAWSFTLSISTKSKKCLLFCHLWKNKSFYIDILKPNLSWILIYRGWCL